MHVIFNAFLMALELAAIGAVAWVGFLHGPTLFFAGGTALMALGLGAALEIARLRRTPV